MPTTSSSNFSPSFDMPSVGTDKFTPLMLDVALPALDGHNHANGKGPAVLRLSSGTAASRPAAGNAGHVYIATDLKQFSFDTGVSWWTLVADGVTIVSPGIQFNNNTAKISFLDSLGNVQQAIYSTAGDTLRIYPQVSAGSIVFRNFADTLNNVIFSDAGFITALGLITGVGFLSAAGRIQGAMGANVNAANSMSLGLDGNLFTIAGATQINLIDTVAWQAGSAVTLLFASTPTVKHNQAPATTFHPIILNGAVDFVAAANNTLSLVYNGTSWFETGRKV